MSYRSDIWAILDDMGTHETREIDAMDDDSCKRIHSYAAQHPGVFKVRRLERTMMVTKYYHTWHDELRGILKKCKNSRRGVLIPRKYTYEHIAQLDQVERFTIDCGVLRYLKRGETARMVRDILKGMVEGESRVIRSSLSRASLRMLIGSGYVTQKHPDGIIVRLHTSLTTDEVRDKVAQMLISGVSDVVPAHRDYKRLVREVAGLLGVKYRLRGFILEVDNGLR